MNFLRGVGASNEAMREVRLCVLGDNSTIGGTLSALAGLTEEVFVGMCACGGL